MLGRAAEKGSLNQKNGRPVLGVLRMERNDVMQREEHGEILRYVESRSES